MVLRASGNLVVALAVAVAASLIFALVAAQLSHDRQQLAWLTIAPLLPALLVAGAYDSTDPIRELADPTPYSKLRVALLRTLVAVLGAVPLVVADGAGPGDRHLGRGLAAAGTRHRLRPARAAHQAVRGRLGRGRGRSAGCSASPRSGPVTRSTR